MRRFSKASAAVAATLVSATAFVGGAVAAEPLRLNAAQMDAVTAGAFAKSNFNAWSNATGKRVTAKTNTDTKARPNATSGKGSATATAKDGSVYTKIDGSSEARPNDRTFAKIEVTATGEAKGDANSTSRGNTSAAGGARVAVAQGTALTKASGDDLKVTATAVPTAEGDITRTISKNRVNERAGVAVAMGVAVAVDLPDQAARKR